MFKVFKHQSLNIQIFSIKFLNFTLWSSNTTDWLLKTLNHWLLKNTLVSVFCWLKITRGQWSFFLNMLAAIEFFLLRFLIFIFDIIKRRFTGFYLIRVVNSTLVIYLAISHRQKISKIIIFKTIFDTVSCDSFSVN